MIEHVRQCLVLSITFSHFCSITFCPQWNLFDHTYNNILNIKCFLIGCCCTVQHCHFHCGNANYFSLQSCRVTPGQDVVWSSTIHVTDMNLSKEVSGLTFFLFLCVCGRSLMGEVPEAALTVMMEAFRDQWVSSFSSFLLKYTTIQKFGVRFFFFFF